MTQLNKLLLTSLLFWMPVYTKPASLSKNNCTAIIQISAGTVSICMAGILVKNVIATAIRRLSNPECAHTKLLSTITKQVLTIFAHNKKLAASTLFALLFGGAMLYLGITNLSISNQKGLDQEQTIS